MRGSHEKAVRRRGYEEGSNPYRDGRPPWYRAWCNGTHSAGSLSDRIHHGRDLRMNAAVDRSRDLFYPPVPLPVCLEKIFLPTGHWCGCSSIILRSTSLASTVDSSAFLRYPQNSQKETGIADFSEIPHSPSPISKRQTFCAKSPVSLGVPHSQVRYCTWERRVWYRPDDFTRFGTLDREIREFFTTLRRSRLTESA